LVISESIKSQVIQKYLDGKSRDQISRETGISTGKISNLVKDWKDGIDIPNIEEVREFAIAVKKSGMSMGQCARGYRIAQLMKNLGIADDTGDNEDEDGDSSRTIDSKYIEFSSFVQDIYLGCKKLKILPSSIFSWIKDLLDCQFQSDYDNSILFIDQQQQQQQQQNEKENELPISSSKLKKDDTLASEIKIIPFISQVSHYITQKKKEYGKLENYQKNLKDDLKKLEIQKNKVTYNLNQLNQNEKFVLSYIEWFYDLESTLWETFSIKLKDDIFSFCQLIKDFKEKGYDAHKIIKEYLKSLSIKLEIKTCEADIATLSNQRASLNNSVLSLESRVNMHKQTIDIYSRLEAMNFGLKELNQLWLTILEIAGENNIPMDEAVYKFLRDVDEQYNNKLGFESKVQEKKNELFSLKNQLNADRLAMQFIPYVVPTLQHLFQNGVTEEDIINMNHLVTKFSKDNFHLNQSDNTNISKDNSSICNNSNNMDRTKHWKLFIDHLEKLQDITLEIRKQIDNRDKIQKEVNDINRQKQEIYTQYQNAISFIGTINNKISYINGFIDYFNKDINNKIKLSSGFLSLPVFIIVYKNKREDEGEDVETNKK
jgi:hypothetical protein